MRKASGMKLTNRLVAFVTLIVICAVFVLFIGGAISFQKLGQDFLSQYLSGMSEVIDQELANPENSEYFSKWLPQLLKASDVVELKIYSDSGVLYHYNELQLTTYAVEIQEFTYPLKHNPGFSVTLSVIPPYSEFAYSLGPMASISLAISIIVLSLIWGGRWLRQQLQGAEMLEDRGRMILAGRSEEVAVGRDEEFPSTASVALDNLIAELNDARQERSRFDTFIRTNTFLDQLTGVANRVMFDSRLKSLVQEQDCRGAVILVRFSDFDDLVQDQGKEVADELIQSISSILSNMVQRYPEAVLARYFDNEFAIMLVHQPTREVNQFTDHLVKTLERLSPPSPMDTDNWCHAGVALFVSGDRRGRIMDEADMALRSAKLQGGNSWSVYKRALEEEEARGSVRWRTLFDHVFNNGGPEFYHQKVVDGQGNKLHDEMLARIRDENGLVIKASRFISGLNAVGYGERLDECVVIKAIEYANHTHSECVSLNVNVNSVTKREFYTWLRDKLLQTPRETRERLIFEFHEGSLVSHLDAMRNVSRMLKGFGCKIIADKAGRTVVSTHYIKDIQPDFIKLHRSLVRDIHQRAENQLFVRSMLGACESTGVRIVAVGVEKKPEWDVLMNLGVYGCQGRYISPELSAASMKRPLLTKVKLGRKRFRDQYTK
ncbi:RNase E specificity factor CsrD [Parasalinivibrio latis]|uniref:RNase E specificity factor CsrD n=1 Tax=Parasalinivibrio latis TaxID=2952610 RepID=UPI0030E28463